MSFAWAAFASQWTGHGTIHGTPPYAGSDAPIHHGRPSVVDSDPTCSPLLRRPNRRGPSMIPICLLNSTIELTTPIAVNPLHFPSCNPSSSLPSSPSLDRPTSRQPAVQAASGTRPPLAAPDSPLSLAPPPTLSKQTQSSVTRLAVAPACPSPSSPHLIILIHFFLFFYSHPSFTGTSACHHGAKRCTARDHDRQTYSPAPRQSPAKRGKSEREKTGKEESGRERERDRERRPRVRNALPGRSPTARPPHGSHTATPPCRHRPRPIFPIARSVIPARARFSVSSPDLGATNRSATCRTQSSPSWALPIVTLSPRARPTLWWRNKNLDHESTVHRFRACAWRLLSPAICARALGCMADNTLTRLDC